MSDGEHITLQLGEHKKFLHIVTDACVVEELRKYPEYRNVLRKITEIGIKNSCDGGFASIVNVDRAHPKRQKDYLRVLADLNFDYGVIWFDGSWPENDFEEALEEQLKDLDDDWLCAGHIMNRTWKPKGRYANWHHQCIVINFKMLRYKDVEVKWQDGTIRDYEASKENIHDDYTPLWLKPLGTKGHYSVREDPYDWLIPTAMHNSLKVYNLNHDVRKKKFCTYPEDDIEDTIKWLLTDDSLENVGDYHALRKTVTREKRELMAFKQQKYQVLYITNTEGIIVNAPKDLDVLIVPCSGINQWFFARNSIGHLKRIVWFDNNPAQIEWMNLVIKKWKGDNFKQFVEAYLPGLIDKYSTGHDRYGHIFDPDQLQKSIDHLGGEEEFKKLFDTIKNAENIFVQMDLTKHPDLTKYITKEDTVLLNGTNIWTYESNWCKTEITAPVVSWMSLIGQLRTNSKQAYYRGDTCFHNFMDMADVNTMMGNR